MREVAPPKAETEGENLAKTEGFSLPQSASLTAPSSEGAKSAYRIRLLCFLFGPFVAVELPVCLALLQKLRVASLGEDLPL